MKKAILTIFLFSSLQVLRAQQRPHYTQYVLNNYVLNPALSGIENYTDVKLSARDQWVGLNGAPKTFYLTVHGPIGKKDEKTTATSFGIPGISPRGNAYWESYTASAPHHGLGMTIINDKTGLYNRFTASATYAYHIGLSPKTNVAAGFAAGISRIGYDRSKAELVDPNDPLVIANSGAINRIRPDLGAGIWVYSADYFAGLSAQQIVPQKVRFTDDASYDGSRLVPHIFATAGYRFLVSEEINMIPSLMLKYVSGSPTNPQFDLNVKCQYLDLLWIGGSYRFRDGFAGMVGMNVANSINVGYAYDITTTSLNTASRGTHEIIIGFLLGNDYGDTCPRNIW